MILLNIEGAARPVRTEPRSWRGTDRALSIRSSASSRVSSITGLPSIGGGALRPSSSVWLLFGRWPARWCSGRLTDQRADLLTCSCSRDVAVAQEVEDDDRHRVVHAQ